ncbi:hypothetical protein MAUB1S_03681 [Mycolicibacterium aubagnense]
MFNATVARLTYRGLLGRRRAFILFGLPALLLGVSVVVRVLVGADDGTAGSVLGGFALGHDGAAHRRRRRHRRDRPGDRRRLGRLPAVQAGQSGPRSSSPN